MRRLFYLFALTFTITLFISCSDRQGKRLYEAMSLTDTEPDSTLALLNTIDRSQLSGKNLALYSLAYTKAQDKSGLDVDNDSLIGIAYDWYKSRKSDSLYATCQYYMGKYYMLNENTEQAIVCLEDARKYAETQKDTALECLALDKVFKEIGHINERRGLAYARKAVSLYSSFSGYKSKNMVFYLLNYGEAYAYSDSITQAVKLVKKALLLSESIDDSEAISSSCQDLANFYGIANKKDSALLFAKYAYNSSLTKNNHVKLALSSAFLEKDSLKQAYSILNNIKTNIPSTNYAKYYTLRQAAIKEGNINNIKAFDDSAYHYIEQMYSNASESKEKYYVSAIKNKEAKSQLENKTLYQRYLFLIISIILIFIVILVTFSLKYEQRMHKKEKLMTERLHKEEVSHREIQLTTMRNYLVKKIDVIMKLENMKNAKKHILLTEGDWDEIEAFLDGVDDMFVSRLRNQFPDMVEKDVKLMMLLRLKLSQKTLADIYCISEKAIKQKLYLYKSKVGIEKGKISLREYIESF